MNFWAQSIASPFRVTPRYDAQKRQTPVSGSVVYNKMPGSFKIGKEREEEKKKLRWQKAGRRHYEPAMSDELFRDTNRPSATWFIDSSKKVPVWRISSVFTEQITSKGKKKGRNQNQTITCWFSTCWGLKWNCCYWRRDWIFSLNNAEFPNIFLLKCELLFYFTRREFF